MKKHMSYPILSVELKRGFKGNMIWSIALGLSLLLIIAIYPMVKDMMASLVELMESMDPSNPFLQILEDFGGIPHSAIEYFATEGALILQLVGGIYAAILGYSMINRDEKEKTNEVLYTLPISRTQSFISKVIAIMIHIFIFTFIQFGLSTLGFLIIDELVLLDVFWLFGLLNFVMFTMIACFGLCLAAILKPNQSSLLAVAIPFPFYIITMISQATNNFFLKALKYISPFTFAEPVGFLKTDHGFEWINFIVFIVITCIFVWVSHVKYKTRQII